MHFSPTMKIAPKEGKAPNLAQTGSASKITGPVQPTEVLP